MIEEIVRLGIILICIMCAVFVYADAQHRGMNAPLWGLLVFLFSVVALPVYLFLRRPSPGLSRVPSKSKPGPGAHTGDPPRQRGVTGICPR